MTPQILKEVREGANRHKVWAGIAIVIAFLAVVIWVPKLSFIQPGGNLTAAERANAESDLRGHLLQALGGLVLVAGAYFTGRTFALNQVGQRTDRFSRAIEQLGNKESTDVRIGGIYALERVSRETAEDHETVMEVLTAYMREHASWRLRGKHRPPGPPHHWYNWFGNPPTGFPAVRPDADVQAVLTVLSRRSPQLDSGESRFDFSEVDLRGARLPEVVLQNAEFNGAHLEDAYLVNACLDRSRFSEAHLEGANLSHAKLRGASLTEAHLDGALLLGADLTHARANEDLLIATALIDSHLSNAHLQDAKFMGATLENADLRGALLYNTHFERAHLTGAHLEGAVFKETHLEGADLSGAVGLTQEQLAAAITDDSTTLPGYLVGEAGTKAEDDLRGGPGGEPNA